MQYTNTVEFVTLSTRYMKDRVPLGSAAMKQISMLKARPDLPFPYKIQTPLKFLILRAGCLKYDNNKCLLNHMRHQIS